MSLVMPNAIMLGVSRKNGIKSNVIWLSHYPECRYAKYHYAKYHCAQYRSDECYYDECRYD
jgi:hypothetical protein